MTDSNSLLGLVGNTNYDSSEFLSTTAYQFSQFLDNQANGLYDDYAVPADLVITNGLYDNYNIFSDSTTTVDIGETSFEVQNIGIFNGSNSINFVDGIEGDSHPDIYQFTIDRSNEFAITLDDLSADADLYIFDSMGEIVAVSNNANVEVESLSGSLDPDTYFLGVASYDGIDTDYSLSVSTGEFALSSTQTNIAFDPTYVSSEFWSI